MRRALPILAVSMAVLLALTLLSSCGGKEAAEPTAGKKVEKPSLPVDFPQDFPLPGGLKLLSSKKSLNENGDLIYAALWQTSQTADEIKNFYREQLPKNGWKIVGDFGGEAPYLTFGRPGDISGSKLRVMKTKKPNIRVMEANVVGVVPKK